MIRQQTILVVDDDPNNVELVRELCQHLGFAVTAVHDAESALLEVRRGRPDLVLLDLQLPNRDGFSVLEALRSEPSTRDLPVIIVTANTDIDAKVRGIELGADDFLTKPFKLFELKTRLRAALQLRQCQDRMRAAEEALSRQSVNDPVTGACMVAQLHTHLDHEVTRARRYGRPLSALMLSVDDLGALRERCGVDSSDELLAAIVAAMMKATRTIDRIFRTDVEEFMVLLPETPLDGALIVADRIRESCSSSDEVTVSFSIGAAAFPHPDVRGGEDLLRAAADAMKAARRGGTGMLVAHE